MYIMAYKINKSNFIILGLISFFFFFFDKLLKFIEILSYSVSFDNINLNFL